jgi:hypothetical protein
MRKTASKVGSLHALWDVIFDIDALVQSRQTLVPREEIERMALQYMAEQQLDWN